MVLSRGCRMHFCSGLAAFPALNSCPHRIPTEIISMLDGSTLLPKVFPFSSNSSNMILDMGMSCDGIQVKMAPML